MGGEVLVLKARQTIALQVAAGQQLRIVNLCGGQIVELWALNAADPDERISMEHTRSALGRLVPQIGDGLYSSRRRVVLRLVVEDTSPGVHDTLIASVRRGRSAASSTAMTTIPTVPRTFARRCTNAGWRLTRCRRL